MLYFNILLSLLLLGASGNTAFSQESRSVDENIILTEPSSVRINKVVEQESTTVSSLGALAHELNKEESSFEILSSANEPIATSIAVRPKKEVLGASVKFDVPFYSQFDDITPVKWKKIGCGVTSLAMLIDYYKPGEVTVDALLDEGVASGAYLQNAGWTHQGLVDLAVDHGLRGRTHDLSNKSVDAAFAKLKQSLLDGPVIASVHYTFDPTNPIPHLVVINGVLGDRVYYNDPSEKSGGNSISVDKFLKSWKKRYIEVRDAV